MTNQDFGDLIRWGKNQNGGMAASEKASLERMKDITDAELRELHKRGITPSMAEEWARVYEDVHAKNPGNLTARGRAPLMQSIADRMRALGIPDVR
jgi:hypothetical protein